jgi:hypothetical protein
VTELCNQSYLEDKKHLLMFFCLFLIICLIKLTFKMHVYDQFIQNKSKSICWKMFFYCFSLYKGNSERTESVNILSGRKKKSYLSLYKSVYYRTNDFASVNHVFVVEFIHVYKLDQQKIQFWKRSIYMCLLYSSRKLSLLWW